MFRILTLVTSVALVTLIASVQHVSAQAADPVLGTWKLNIAKSTFSGSAPKSITRTWAQTPDGIKQTSTTVDANGNTVTGEYMAIADGKDRPVKGAANVDSISIKRLDAYRVSYEQKKNGKVVTTGTREISKDGKVMTITGNGKDAAGQATKSVQVYDKQ